MDEEAMATRCEAPLFAGREALPPLWDAELVGKRLVQAFVTLDRLPRLRPARPVGIGRARSPNGPINWPKRSSKKANAGPGSKLPIAP
jgi:hypothetical protein